MLVMLTRITVWNNRFSYWFYRLWFIGVICHVGGVIWFKLGGEGSSILGWVWGYASVWTS